MTTSTGRHPRASRHLPLVAIIGGGLVLRLWLAFVAFPGQGLAGDLGLFQSWATTLARVGPGAFYASASSANYPPGYMYILWLLGSLGTPVGALLGVSNDRAVPLLLKLPAIGADVGIALLLAWAGRRWFGGRAGLLAAALYLFIPVTWYDSALWGQVDAVGALLMMAAVIVLIEGWSEPAVALAVLSLLVKPQDAIALVVVVPILVRRHMLRVGTGPVPTLGPRLAGLDRRLGGLLRDQGPIRLGTCALVAAVAGIVVLLPFDIARLGPASLADVPVVGHVAGLIGLFASVGGQFSVLTANAYNAWALVGPAPLASAIGASGGTWTADSLLVGGLPAVTIGGALLVSVGLLVAGGLLVRDGRLPILLGFSLVAFGFYALPTRVHERYLFPFFASGALLAAGSATRALGYAGVGLANAVNLHAVLAAPLSIGFGAGGGGLGGGLGGLDRGPTGLAGAAGRAVGGSFGSATSIALPLADLARSQAVVVAVALGQTAALAILVVAWLAVVTRGPSVAWLKRGRSTTVSPPVEPLVGPVAQRP